MRFGVFVQVMSGPAAGESNSPSSALASCLKMLAGSGAVIEKFVEGLLSSQTSIVPSSSVNVGFVPLCNKHTSVEVPAPLLKKILRAQWCFDLPAEDKGSTSQ